MSTCLKTGGLVHLEAHNCYYECDLHIIGNCVIAYTAGPAQYDPSDKERTTVKVLRSARYFEREGKPYGIIVACQQDCELSPEMKDHCLEYYDFHTFDFANHKQ